MSTKPESKRLSLTRQLVEHGVRTTRRSCFTLCLGLLLMASGSVPSLADDFDTAFGGGEYLFGGSIEIDFAFHATQKADGRALGNFRQSLVFQGQAVEFHGEVTCLAVDSVTGRAWIGGVVRHNMSEHPSFTGDIHQPGRDVWFRVLDSDGTGEPDRSTFLGFEGGGGIITSEEYCEAQIWPDDNARTHPVTKGQIKVRAK